MNNKITAEMLRDLLRSQPDHDLIPDSVLELIIEEVDSGIEQLKERILHQAIENGLVPKVDKRICFLIGLATGAVVAHRLS